MYCTHLHFFGDHLLKINMKSSYFKVVCVVLLQLYCLECSPIVKKGNIVVVYKVAVCTNLPETEVYLFN